MSSQPKAITKPNVEAAERMSREMGKRLQAAAGAALQKKVATGEVKIINGRYVMGDSMKVTRPSSLCRKAHTAG